MAPSPDDDCIIIGMVLVDGVHGVFHSHVVIDQALRHWIAFLTTRLGLDFNTWQRRCLPTPSQQAIYVPQREHITVPAGSRLVFDLPAALSTPLVEEVRKRSLDT